MQFYDRTLQLAVLRAFAFVVGKTNPKSLLRIKVSSRKQDAREKIARGLVHQAAGQELESRSSDCCDTVNEDAEIKADGVSRLAQELNKHRVVHSSPRSVRAGEIKGMVVELINTHSSFMCLMISFHRGSITRPQLPLSQFSKF